MNASIILDFKNAFPRSVSAPFDGDSRLIFPVFYRQVICAFNGFRERLTNHIPSDFSLFSYADSIESFDCFSELYDSEFFQNFIFIGSDNLKRDFVILMLRGEEIGVFSLIHDLGTISQVSTSTENFLCFLFEASIQRMMDREKSPELSSKSMSIAAKYGIQTGYFDTNDGTDVAAYLTQMEETGASD